MKLPVLLALFGAVVLFALLGVATRRGASRRAGHQRDVASRVSDLRLRRGRRGNAAVVALAVVAVVVVVLLVLVYVPAVGQFLGIAPKPSTPPQVAGATVSVAENPLVPLPSGEFYSASTGTLSLPVLYNSSSHALCVGTSGRCGGKPTYGLLPLKLTRTDGLPTNSSFVVSIQSIPTYTTGSGVVFSLVGFKAVAGANTWQADFDAGSTAGISPSGAPAASTALDLDSLAVPPSSYSNIDLHFVVAGGNSTGTLTNAEMAQVGNYTSVPLDVHVVSGSPSNFFCNFQIVGWVN